MLLAYVAGDRGWVRGERELVSPGSRHGVWGAVWNLGNPSGEGAELLWTLRRHELEGQLSPRTLTGPPQHCLPPGPGVSRVHVYQSLRRCPNVKPFALLEPGLRDLVSTFSCERRRASKTAPLPPGPPGALAPSLLGAPSRLLSTPPFRGCRPLGGGRCVHRLRVLLSLARVCLQARWLPCELRCPLPESAVNHEARPSHPRRPGKLAWRPLPSAQWTEQVPPRPAAIMPEVSSVDRRKPKITASRKLLLKVGDEGPRSVHSVLRRA
nr:uncharacterized protein LOC131767500 [Kogia breviceps]